MNSPATQTSLDETAQALRATGARVTGARIAILQLLKDVGRALSHREVEEALAGAQIDRVTVYRVLDWLTAEGLAHKIADAERVFRFSAVGGRDHAHGHFTCRQCHNVFCLPAAAPVQVTLPTGFRADDVELSVTGHCADCAA